MTKSTKTKSAKQRVKVKDLPISEKKLRVKEMEKVKGGSKGKIVLWVRDITQNPDQPG